METIEQSQETSTQQGMRLLKSFVSTTPFAPGRRPFFKYRDLGLEGATGGRMRAYQNNSIAGMTEPIEVRPLRGHDDFDRRGAVRIQAAAGRAATPPLDLEAPARCSSSTC